MDANGTVHGVTGRNTNGGKVVYDVAATVEMPEGPQQQKLATFDGNLAKTAQGLTNQRASFRFEVKQNGQYTNWYLNEIAPEGQLGADNGIPIVNGNGQGGQRRGGGGGYKRSPEETASIVKQNVLGTAHSFIGQLYQGLGPEFIEAAKDEAKKYAAELFEIAKPKPAAGAPVEVPATTVPATAPATAPIIPTATTPAEVAAGVPGVQVGAPAATEQAPAASDIAWN